MAKQYMERIEALRQQYLSTRVDMDVYNAKYVTEGFKETEGQPWIIQKATGYARTCEKKQIYIQDHELLVGGVGFKPAAASSTRTAPQALSRRKSTPFRTARSTRSI